MALNRLSFLMFLIPIVIGIKTTVSKVEPAVNSDNVKLTNATLTEVVNNSVGVMSIMTEGGSIATKPTIPIAVKNATLLTKPQSNQGNKNDNKEATLIKTDSDPVLDNKDSTIIKAQTDPLLDIPIKNTGKSVVGRKGVNFKEEDSAEETKAVNAADHPAKASDANTSTVSKNKAAVNNIQPKKTESTTPIAHKPTVLSYSALENSGDKDKTLSLLEEGLKNKQVTNPGSHPGMIMPIVITVLVVPMFAVLGYMALKRGQEAWKNRHYKRMDFLLDGMYND